MTLVVLWRRESSLLCVADTAISNPNSTLTDSGAKLFIAPVAAHVYCDGQIVSSRHTSFGFAFAGSTLPAMNTHALASTCTQMLFHEDDKPLPSLNSIAMVYAQIGSFYINNINSHTRRRSAEFKSFIFGYCPRNAQLELYVLHPEYNADICTMTAHHVDVGRGRISCIGSGEALFAQQLDNFNAAGRPINPLAIFLDIVRNSDRADIGGYPQIAEADETGVRLHPILSPDDNDKDRANLKMLGFPLMNLGTVDGYRLGYHAYGLGLETIRGRQALREKGILPDADVPAPLQALASVEYMLRSMIDMPNDKFVFDEMYVVAPPIPTSGTWYLTVQCPSCPSTVLLCADATQGEALKRLVRAA